MKFQISTTEFLILFEAVQIRDSNQIQINQVGGSKQRQTQINEISLLGTINTWVESIIELTKKKEADTEEQRDWERQTQICKKLNLRKKNVC